MKIEQELVGLSHGTWVRVWFVYLPLFRHISCMVLFLHSPVNVLILLAFNHEG
jgi:hypothetical protein